MNMDVKNIANGISLNPGDRAESDRAQIQLLAQQFEAMLMTQMLREMRKSMLDDEDKDDAFGFGNEAMTDTGDIELGNALSKTGGVGLAETMLKAFQQQIGAAGGQTRIPGLTPNNGEAVNGAGLTPGNAATLNELPSASMIGLAPKPVDGLTPSDVGGNGRISSPFGWRPDPFTGASKFHQGVDIAMAYGHDVKAAAEGTVSFAGIQGSYGHTVVIDHADGRQTRYAHLSAPLVQAGDAVQEGQIVGKSGNSGRSTGPHLHFEVLVHGKPVDPSSLAES